MGNVTEMSGENGSRTCYTYTPNGNLAYDKNGRMTDKWDRDGYHTAYTYDNRGLITGILYGDGTSVAYIIELIGINAGTLNNCHM